jgi:ferredoxin
VTLRPLDRVVEVASGATLLKAAQSADVEMPWVCGGNRICTTCRCLIEGDADSLAPPDEPEREILETVQLAPPWWLGCQVRVLRDVIVSISPDLSIPPAPTVP